MNVPYPHGTRIVVITAAAAERDSRICELWMAGFDPRLPLTETTILEARRMRDCLDNVVSEFDEAKNRRKEEGRKRTALRLASQPRHQGSIEDKTRRYWED